MEKSLAKLDQVVQYPFKQAELAVNASLAQQLKSSEGMVVDWHSKNPYDYSLSRCGSSKEDLVIYPVSIETGGDINVAVVSEVNTDDEDDDEVLVAHAAELKKELRLEKDKAQLMGSMVKVAGHLAYKVVTNGKLF